MVNLLTGKNKGIGYVVEAFVASLTLFIFAAGTVSSPASQDWNRFQNQLEAEDVSYAVKESGHMSSFLERSETGSLKTAVSTLSNDLEASGTVENLPIRESRIGFFVREEHVYHMETNSSVADNDKCYENNDLEEINSEFPIKRAETQSPVPAPVPVPLPPAAGPSGPFHGVHLYLADSDPRIPEGFDGEKNYDSLWVDNGTRCQFSASEGPYYREQFFFWGNTSDSDPDDNYDLKNIRKDGTQFTVYNATQLVRFRDAMKEPVNGIGTDTSFDTFNFSKPDLDVYNVLVFRRESSLLPINMRLPRMMEYLESGSVLFLMDLEQSDLSGGFMDRTGLEWINLDWTSKPEDVDFPENSRAENVETYYVGQDGDKSRVTMLPGGNISSGLTETLNSGPKMVLSGKGKYTVDDWNATHMSMLPVIPPPPDGVEGCGNFNEGDFEFPDDTYHVVSSQLGSSSCTDIWALYIDLDHDGDMEEKGEGPLLNGDTLEVDDRKYLVRIYPDSDCPGDKGECADFIFRGSDRVEIVNYRTKFENREIQRFARAGFEGNYSRQDRKVLASTIYWLAGDTTTFGTQESTKVSNTVIGSVENNVYMPYTVSMRWER